MSLRAKLEVVRIVEADCAVRRAAIGASWRGFKNEAALAATPKRVVISGLVAGFLAGLPNLGKGSGSLLGGKLLDLLMDSAFANIGAAIGAGVAAAQAADEPKQPAATETTGTRP